MEAFNCGICLERYDEDEQVPRSLTECGHTICEICALKIMENAKVLCPFDRIESDVPDGNIKFLKKNFAILEAIQKLALGIPCDEDSTHMAVLYCTICKAHYCTKCSKSSHTSRTHSSHKMVKVTEKPEPLLMCPLHENNVAELYCHDKRCEVASKLMCLKCYLIGVHKGHDFKSIDEILEVKKKMADDIVNKTNTKKELIKSHLNSIGELPECVESYEEYIKMKNHLEAVCEPYQKQLDNWKKENLDQLRKQAKDAIQEQKKDRLNYNSQLAELEIIANKCLNAKKQGTIEFFEKSADIETIGKQVDCVDIKEPGKIIELVIKPFRSSFTLQTSSSKILHSSNYETKKPKRKIVFVDVPEDLQRCQDRLKELSGFKGILNNSIHMQGHLISRKERVIRNLATSFTYEYDDYLRVISIQPVIEKSVFESIQINTETYTLLIFGTIDYLLTLLSTSFVILCLNKMAIDKMKVLSKDTKIIVGCSKAELKETDSYKDNRITFNQISAPTFLGDWNEPLFMKQVCEGNYENNPFFERFLWTYSV